MKQTSKTCCDSSPCFFVAARYPCDWLRMKPMKVLVRAIDTRRTVASQLQLPSAGRGLTWSRCLESVEHCYPVSYGYRYCQVRMLLKAREMVHGFDDLPLLLRLVERSTSHCLALVGSLLTWGDPSGLT